MTLLWVPHKSEDRLQVVLCLTWDVFQWRTTEPTPNPPTLYPPAQRYFCLPPNWARNRPLWELMHCMVGSVVNVSVMVTDIMGVLSAQGIVGYHSLGLSGPFGLICVCFVVWLFYCLALSYFILLWLFLSAPWVRGWEKMNAVVSK